MTVQPSSTATEQACAKFVMWALMNGSWQGADIDGGAAQDKAAELGLIVKTIYDPVQHGANDYADAGDSWYVPTEALANLISGAAQRPIDLALSDLIAAKMREPAFAAWKTEYNEVGLLPIIKVGPTAVSDWRVALMSGREIGLRDEEWKSAALPAPQPSEPAYAPIVITDEMVESGLAAWMVCEKGPTRRIVRTILEGALYALPSTEGK
jgi:hypothetical protein